jgi:MFS transporter, PHS family, inorganic phosphate transporter
MAAIAGLQAVADLLDDAPRSRFHRRAVVISGMGFFTDAYDLFVISTVATLVTTQWHLSTTAKSWVLGSAILGAFFGALVFGRIADLLGRKRVYVLVAVIMIVGALLSAVATNLWLLVAARLVLGIGIGGDYPVSAVLMSEYANRSDRGRMVGLVFSMQALGLIIGPLVALALLAGGVPHEIAWRVLLGLGAVPAAAVVYLRSRMPESPRFRAAARGDATRALAELETFTEGTLHTNGTARATRNTTSNSSGTAGVSLWQLLRTPRLLVLLLGTAGSWLFFDYAYYGNTLSLPTILKKVAPSASLDQQLIWTLGIFVVCALPGYLMAVKFMDRIGHKKLQLIGFAVMAVAFLLLGAFSPLTTNVAPFLAIFGVSYFFVEFGPNTTTFVMPSEVFPLRVRATGHGTAAGLGKLGAFIGVFLVPSLQKSIGLRGMLVVAAASALLGILLTLLLPEPAGRSLDDLDHDAMSVTVPAPTFVEADAERVLVSDPAEVASGVGVDPRVRVSLTPASVTASSRAQHGSR